MKHVVSLSGGLGSFWAAHRVIERYGRDDVTLVFADVKMEDEDLYRFLVESTAYLGVPLTVIADGRTPWDVFFDERFLGNTRADPCSKILKRRLLDKFTQDNFDPLDTTLYIGIDWTEIDRRDRVRKRLPGWVVKAPMCGKPYTNKCKMIADCEALGIKVPRLYGYGFPHNNCGGMCVKAGQASFAKLLEHFPERYAYHEGKEKEFRARFGDFSILRDRRGGKTKPMTLEAFRHRIEAGESFDRNDWGGCGCALE